MPQPSSRAHRDSMPSNSALPSLVRKAFADFVLRAEIFLTDGTGYPFPVFTSSETAPLPPAVSTSSSFSDSTNSVTAATPASPSAADPLKRHAGSTPYSFQVHSLHALPKHQQRDRNRETVQLILPNKIEAVAIRTGEGTARQESSDAGGSQRRNYRNYDSSPSPWEREEETDGLVWSSLVVSKRASRRQWGKGNAFLDGMRVAKNAARERDSMQHR